jgi:hypothetical protein
MKLNLKKSYEVVLAVISSRSVGMCVSAHCVAVQMERVQSFEMLVPAYRVSQCHNHMWYADRVPASCTSYCRFIFQDCVLTWLLCSQALLNNSRLLTSSCSLSYDRSIGFAKAS